MESRKLIVWVCPNCDNYYASANAGNLLREWNTDLKGERTFTRSRCPNRGCAEQGVHREPIEVLIEREEGEPWRVTTGDQLRDFQDTA